jgi:hypothetical protein
VLPTPSVGVGLFPLQAETTNARINNMKIGPGYRAAIQKMIKQVQSKLKKTQVATVSAMDDFDPVVPLGDNAQEK